MMVTEFFRQFGKGLAGKALQPLTIPVEVHPTALGAPRTTALTAYSRATCQGVTHPAKLKRCGALATPAPAVAAAWPATASYVHGKKHRLEQSIGVRECRLLPRADRIVVVDFPNGDRRVRTKPPLVRSDHNIQAVAAASRYGVECSAP